ATPPPSLADELKSLRIDRGPARRSLPRCVPVAVAIALAEAQALIGWRALGGRLFAPEVDTATVALITPAQGAQLLVATGYVVPGRARVDVARVKLDNYYVRARFSGRITQKLTDVGAIVFGFTSAGNAGNGGIASLADFESLQVEADVSESQVAKLAIGT